jgi:hypothetical protein
LGASVVEGIGIAGADAASAGIGAEAASAGADAGSVGMGAAAGTGASTAGVVAGAGGVSCLPQAARAAAATSVASTSDFFISVFLRMTRT